MDDALLVRRREGLGHGGPYLHDSRDRQAAFGYQAVERLALDELHRQEVNTVGFLHRVDRDDVRMVESGEGLRFTLKAREPIGVAGRPGGQDLERDAASKLRVLGPVHLPHPSGADGRGDAVVGKSAAGGQGHAATAPSG